MIEFHPLALDEMQAALSWYREKSMKAALRFLRGVDQAVDRVIADPSSYPVIGSRYRYVRIKKFPFILAYEIRGANDVLIVAIAHTSRRKSYWSGRA